MLIGSQRRAGPTLRARRACPTIGCLLVAGLGLVVASSRPAFALDPTKSLTQYELKFWRTTDGLPNSHVQAILQTRDGYLWLGTEEGLARFDGVTFTVFNRDNTPALASNSICGLLEDAQGTLWVGSLGGLNGYKDGRWGAALTTANGLPNARINHLVPARDGGMWIATQGGLARLRSGVIETVTPADGPIQEEVTAVLEDADGTLWLGTMTQGLVRIRDGHVVRFTTKDGLAANLVRGLAKDAAGRLWIGTGAGLCYFANGRFSTHAAGDVTQQFAAEAIVIDRAGSVWVPTNRGLGRTQGDSLALLGEQNGLSGVAVVHEDRAGSLWIGTGSGLARLSDGRFTVYTSREGLGLDDPWSVVEDREGTLWVGNAQGLYARRRDGRVVTYASAQGLKRDVVRTLTAGRDGSLWIGSRTSGLFRLKDGRITAYAAAEGLRGLAVRAIHEAADGTLWIGTRDGGLNRFKDGRFTVFTTRDGLAHDGITSIRQTPDGDLWVGAISGGLTRLHDGRFQVYTARDGLPADDILALQEDRAGGLWIGTSRGLGRFHAGRFTSYTKRRGLCDDLVLSVLDDGRGDLWLTSNKGICRVSRTQIEALDKMVIQSLTPHVYTTADGLPTDEGVGVEQNTSDRASDGRLWFAMSRGLATLDPGGVQPEAEALRVDLEEVRVDKRVTTANVHAPGAGELEFRYTAPTLLRPERVTFKYILEGFDTAWTNAERRRTAYYTNIPPGRYRFRVVSVNEDGVAGEQGASFALQLRPHYYQTLWFSVLCMALAAAGIYGLHRFRVRRLKAREAELARRVEEGLAEIKVLSGLIPICASCKSIRNDEGFWDRMESYIERHSQALFSHGICPECMLKLYPEYAQKVLDRCDRSRKRH
jgi:ligand-binding sensor domain-containing protein